MILDIRLTKSRGTKVNKEKILGGDIWALTIIDAIRKRTLALNYGAMTLNKGNIVF